MPANLDPAKVEANGLKTGSLTLWQTTSHALVLGSYVDATGQGFYAHFQAADPLSVLLNQGTVDTYGACSVSSTGATAAPALGTTTWLNAGAPMTLTAADGTTQTLIQPTLIPVGDYSGSFTKNLTAGSYSLKNGSGGSDVGSFTASLTLPAPFTWSSLNGILQIDRSVPLTLNWTGGSGDVVLYGTSYVLVGRTLVGAQFACLAKASDTTLTVPPYVLAALPASQTVNSQMQGYLTVVNAAATTNFSATGLDVGIFYADYQYNVSAIIFN
jgi:hypothetical protein